jgi:hypothetical protein
MHIQEPATSYSLADLRNGVVKCRQVARLAA